MYSLDISEAKMSSADSPALTVESIDNHIYFYSQVNQDRCLALIRQLREIDNRLRSERIGRSVKHKVPIWLHINSFGGDIFAAMGVADQILQLETPVYSVVEGVCASAGTIISVPCVKRYIQENSYMLIHQFKSWFWGTHEEFKDEMVLQEMLIKRMIKFYSAHTSMSKKEIRKALKHDFWVDAKGAVELGLADERL